MLGALCPGWPGRPRPRRTTTYWCQNRLEVSGAGPGLTAWRAAQRGPTDVTVMEPPGGLVLHFAAAWPALHFELWSIEPGNDL